MSQNKNNETVWSTRITKDTSSIFQKVGIPTSINNLLLFESLEMDYQSGWSWTFFYFILFTYMIDGNMAPFTSEKKANIKNY